MNVECLSHGTKCLGCRITAEESKDAAVSEAYERGRREAYAEGKREEAERWAVIVARERKETEARVLSVFNQWGGEEMIAWLRNRVANADYELEAAALEAKAKEAHGN